MRQRVTCGAVSPLLLFCLMAVIASQAQTFSTLAYFNQTNGYFPAAAMIQGFDGNLYGTTVDGGAAESGTLFEMPPGAQLTTLYSFCAQGNCADGQFPYSALVQDQSGNFWGTTKGGPPYGFGTIFKITPDRTESTVYAFSGTDGSQPRAGLSLGSDGNLYGTTSSGGSNDAGTVFKITPAGTLTTLYNFDFSDSFDPSSGLVLATNRDFYGTTSGCCGNGAGTVFKMTPVGLLTTLYRFCANLNCTDGEFPDGTLTQAADGNLYGTTVSGGTVSGCNNSTCGTVFKITQAGVLTTLYNFCTEPNCMDGGQPVVGLVQGTDGNFYGATTFGGANGYGTIFKISPRGKFTLLHTFDGVDGSSPNGGLMQDTNGTFYGTTPVTVFSLSVGLHPFVKTNPSSGKVGSPVIILGTNLTGATSITFNGTAAAFSVVSDSEIETTVPAGATTGAVKVVTPTTTLKGNTRFRVTK